MSGYFEENYEECSQIERRVKSLRRGQNIAAAPQVSVIIPAYQIADFVAETLDSVFAQTFQNYEVIIVNDGSLDSPELIKNLEPFFDQIIYVEQENCGASMARNLAICLSRGELLAFLDGDDVWLPDFLSSQIQFLETNELEMIYCDAELFGDSVKKGANYSDESPSNGAVTPASLLGGTCNVITSGTILRKKVFSAVKMFDISLRRMQDFDLWFRLAKSGAKIGYQKKVLLKYRVRNDSLSGTNVERSRRNIKALNTIRDKYELNAAEKKIWLEQMQLSEAELELEQGKLSLTTNDYATARQHFAVANQYFRNPKLSAVMFLMRISPKLTLRLFKKIRPAEYLFIAPQ